MEPRFLEKIVGTLLINGHTLFMLPVQKDTLFKMLNSENVYTIYKMSKMQHPENHTLFNGTYLLGPNKGVPWPTGQLSHFFCLVR